MVKIRFIVKLKVHLYFISLLIKNATTYYNFCCFVSLVFKVMSYHMALHLTVSIDLEH